MIFRGGGVGGVVGHDTNFMTAPSSQHNVNSANMTPCLSKLQT